MGIKFYDIKSKYVDFLRMAEPKIPYINYDKNDKFVCGVVLHINNVNYYAPISSFNQKQFTNFPIYHNGKIISTIRFSYMFPCIDDVLLEKDFSLEKDIKYRDLLENEWQYCNNQYMKINKKAAYIYKRYMSGKDLLLLEHSCNFPLLEQRMNEYILKTQAINSKTDKDLINV